MPSREEAAPRGSNLLVKRQRLRDRQETDRGWVGMEGDQNFSIKGHHPKRRQVLGSQTYWSKLEMRALDQERGTEGRAGWVGMEVQDFQIKDAKLTGGRFTRGSNLLV